MNKLLVVLVAVCLVSVHAFVKRDAPAPESSSAWVDTASKNMQAFGKNVQDELTKTFDPDKIKEGFSSFVDTLNEAVKSMTSQKEAPKA